MTPIESVKSKSRQFRKTFSEFYYRNLQLISVGKKHALIHMNVIRKHFYGNVFHIPNYTEM